MLSGLSGYLKGVKNALHGNPAQAKTPTLGRIRVGRRELEEIKLISQGGYAYVFKVRDMNTGEIFALKKMICQSPERFQTAKNEINTLRMLPSHPNLLQVFDSSIETKDDCYYVYVLMEFCEGGSVFDLMEKYEASKLSEKQILFVMKEICEGVRALHSCKPPIAHRDLKIENVLLNQKRFKLCDFGSCSTSRVDFAKVPQNQYIVYEEEYEKNTTLMYRPPEMCDPYQRQVVCEKVDIWMLGCILYTMCFYKHPFQEMTKLSIVNAAYTFPQEHPYPEKLIDLIRIMLTPNPNYRPSIFDICEILNNYSSIKTVKLNPDAQRIKEEQSKQDMELKKFEGAGSRLPKFDGDIPIEELMKIQKQLRNDEDPSPMNHNTHPGNQMARNRSQSGTHASRPQKQDHFDSFDSFGQAPKKQPQQNQPHIQQFFSSPGVQQSSDWHDFGNQDKQKMNGPGKQWDEFGKPHQVTQSSSFAQFATIGKQNQSNQVPKADNKLNDKWQNFDFNTMPSGPSSTKNSTNPANTWTSDWGKQNQSQQPQFQAQQPQLQTQKNQFQVQQPQFQAQQPQFQAQQNQFQAQNNQFPGQIPQFQVQQNQFQAQPQFQMQQNQFQGQQAQFQAQPMNGMQGNGGQMNNTWNSFGGQPNNFNSGNNPFSPANITSPTISAGINNMVSPKQTPTVVLTDNLLDLADTSSNSKDASSNIMALYSMKI